MPEKRKEIPRPAPPPPDRTQILSILELGDPPAATAVERKIQQHLQLRRFAQRRLRPPREKVPTEKVKVRRRFDGIGEQIAIGITVGIWLLLLLYLFLVFPPWVG